MSGSRGDLKEPLLTATLPSITGEVAVPRVGITLVGEWLLDPGNHLLDGPSPLYPDLWDRPISLSIIGALRRDVRASRENVDLGDLDAAREELAGFAAAGGGAILTWTGTDPIQARALRNLSTDTGVTLLAGIVPGGDVLRAAADTGGAAVASAVARSLAEAAAAGLPSVAVGLVDLADDSTGVQATIPGILEGAGAAGLVAVLRPRTLPTITAIRTAVADAGLDPSRVLIEVDADPDPSTITAGAAAGGAYGGLSYGRVLADEVFAAADAGLGIVVTGFGREIYDDRAGTGPVRDPERITAVRHLVERGHLAQIVVGSDLRYRTQLRRYGGWGYRHVPASIMTMMGRAGLAPKEISTVLVWNPARLLLPGGGGR